MTDDQSFAVMSEALPRLAGAGAFSPRHMYSKADIAGIVAYARDRGIAVIPEFDMPGHSTSWQKGYPNITSRCSNASKLGFTKPMDVTANATYSLIETLLREMDPLFPIDFPFWHLGGDEVAFDCWRQSDGGYIDHWMNANGIPPGEYSRLQEYFEQRMVELVRGLKKRTVLWEDNTAQHTAGLPKDAVVELWKERKGNATVLDATIKAGWEVVYTSPDWYLDHWLGKSNLEVGSWKFLYSLDPLEGSKLDRATLERAVLGGEVCAWAPYFDSANMLTQTFPRAAAVAERLWSAASVTDVADAEQRLHAWRCRLLRRGLPTAPVNGGIATGGDGMHISAGPTSFGGHCASGPWEPRYEPPW